MRARRFHIAFACALALAPVAARAASPVPEAVAQFEAGEYPRVVELLRSAVDSGSLRDPVERAQAFRLYGIACVLLDDRYGAETAFLKWLKLEPRARLDALLVRPEVVEFFNRVRARHREDLIREVERRRPRSPILNLLPPAGQFQNGHRTKFALVLSAEVALLGVNLATGLTLYRQRHPENGTVPDYDAAQRLVVVNWVSFAALAGVVVYGIVDGFYHYGRIRRQLEQDAASLRAGLAPRPPSVKLAASPLGLSLRF